MHITKIANWLSQKIKDTTHVVLSFDHASKEDILCHKDLLDFFRLAQKNITLRTENLNSNYAHFGDHSTATTGTGLEFFQSRPYISGDERRFINWKLSARSQQLMLNQFQQPTAPVDFILLDLQPAMYFGTQKQTLLSLALKKSLIEIIRSTRSQRNCRLIIMSNHPQALDIKEPAQSIELLSKIGRSERQTLNYKTDLFRHLKNLKKQNPEHANIHILSLFNGITDKERNLLQTLAAKNKLFLYRLRDPIESNIVNYASTLFHSLIDNKSFTINDVNTANELNIKISEQLSAFSDLQQTNIRTQHLITTMSDMALIKDQ